jgi:hypothetical protein
MGNYSFSDSLLPIDIETLSFDSFERNASVDIVCLEPIRTMIRREEEVTLVRKVRKVEEIESKLSCPTSTTPVQPPQSEPDEPYVEQPSSESTYSDSTAYSDSAAYSESTASTYATQPSETLTESSSSTLYSAYSSGTESPFAAPPGESLVDPLSFAELSDVPAAPLTIETGELLVYANASVDQIRDRNIYELRDRNQFVGTLWSQGLLPSLTNRSGQPITVEIMVDSDSQWTYGPKDEGNQFDLPVGADGNLGMLDKEAAEQDMLFYGKAPNHLPPAALVSFKIGDSPFGYDYVAHGKQQQFTLQPGETIYFICNDEPGFYYDNKGHLTVQWRMAA